MKQINNIIINCPMCGQIHESAVIHRQMETGETAQFFTCMNRNLVFRPRLQADKESGTARASQREEQPQA